MIVTDLSFRDQNNAEAYYWRGRAKEDLKNYKGAIADYSEALVINPIDLVVYSERGAAKEKL